MVLRRYLKTPGRNFRPLKFQEMWAKQPSYLRYHVAVATTLRLCMVEREAVIKIGAN